MGGPKIRSKWSKKREKFVKTGKKLALYAF